MKRFSLFRELPTKAVIVMVALCGQSHIFVQSTVIPVEGVELSFMPQAVGASEGKALSSLLYDSTTYRLSKNEGGIFMSAGEADGEGLEFTMAEAPDGDYSFAALRDLQNQIVAAMSDAGYFGVVVSPDPKQFNLRDGTDLRKGSHSLTFNVWLNQVVEVRTVGKGARVAGDDAVNHRMHSRILKNSPVQPEAGSGVLVDKHELDNYMERVNRHPARRVDASLASAGAPGAVVLDYVVNEPKPWMLYAQLSNTGTESTGEWRQRIGGSHHQLTGNDDTLTLDYLTSEFDQANAFFGSYEIPLIFPDYLTARVYGSYSDFDAENLVIPAAANFEGETVTYGGELRYTPVYAFGHAVTAYAGLEYQDIEVDNILALTKGEATLLKPYVGLEATKNKQTHRSRLSLGFEFNSDTSNSVADLTSLGRIGTTDDYELVTFDFFQSFYLEPLFSGYHQPDPDNWKANALVHELAFSVRGQYALGDARLIPQEQIAGGGLFSVRGYDESIARGDSGVIASAEYRLHIARLLTPSALLPNENVPGEAAETSPQARRFNYRAPNLYGLPDWDLMLRGFVDYADFTINDRQINETEDELLSAGVGIEFQYRSNFNIRLDYGFVLKDLEDFAGNPINGAESGDSRLHVIATFSY